MHARATPCMRRSIQRSCAARSRRRLQNTNNIGIFVGNNGRVMINRSVITGNVQIGLGVSGLQAASQVNISNSVVSNNGLGIGNLGGTVTLRLSNNDVSFNNTAFSGAIQSHNDNRVQGNVSIGVAPTPIGATSNPSGLQ